MTGSGTHSIRDFPDHATFREKSETASSEKLGDFLSLNLCNQDNFYLLSIMSSGKK